MEAGVVAPRAFVFFAAAGSYGKNARHEMACALALGKPLVVVHEAAGPPLDAGRS